MIQPIVILFVVVSFLFASAHILAVEASLYWYYWWFDILMHFWGGLLIALGVVSLATFRWVTIKPRLMHVLLVAIVVVVGWEFFEWQNGLMNPVLHLSDSIGDMLLGIGGSIIGYTFLKRLRK